MAGIFLSPSSSCGTDAANRIQLTATKITGELQLVSLYPNPFNPITNIEFGLEQDAHVQIKIYDISGREIVELENGQFLSGYHNLKWNAERYSCGLYFLTISSNGITTTQKLILLK